MSLRCIDKRWYAAIVVFVGKTHQLQIRVSAEDKARVRARASRPDARSYTFAELQDWFHRLTGGEFIWAVRHAPEAPLPPFEANYLAATVEHAAAIKGVDPPRWTATVEPLDAPWFASSLRSLRLHLLTHSPPPFRRRNLFIDSSVGQRV